MLDIHSHDARFDRRGVLTVVLAILLSSAGTAAALDLKVDIGVTDDGVHTSSTPNAIQAGFSGFNVDPQSNGGPTKDFVTPGVIPVIRNISGVNVTIVGGSNGGFFYDMVTEVSGALGDLAEDGVFVVDGDLTVTLAGLPAGAYQMTAYHH